MLIVVLTDGTQGTEHRQLKTDINYGTGARDLGPTHESKNSRWVTLFLGSGDMSEAREREKTKVVKRFEASDNTPRRIPESSVYQA
jgi:hypothetical protein